MNIKNIVKILSLLLVMSCQTIIDTGINDGVVVNGNVYTYKENKIWYEDIGDGDTFLFIHGLGSSTFTWRYLKEYYSLTHRVICIDLKGFGKSSKPLNSLYTVEEQSSMIKNFIEEKDLHNVTMVGHSYGGAIVLSSYLTANRELQNSIDRLILIDSPAYIQKIPNYISVLRTPVLNDISLNIMPSDFNSQIILRELVYDESVITPLMISTYGDLLKGQYAQNALKKTAESIIPENIEQLITMYKDIPIPVLIIWGEDDIVIKMDIGVRLHNNISRSTFVSIDNCGHIPQEENPRYTIKIIDEFIKIN